MSEIDLAWAAGFIEGEGSIFIGRRWREDRKNWETRVVISVSNTNRTLLEVLRKLFGGSIYPRNMEKRHKSGNLGRKQIYQWDLHYRLALACAYKIHPFMRGPKKRVIEDIIKHYERKSRKPDRVAVRS